MADIKRARKTGTASGIARLCLCAALFVSPGHSQAAECLAPDAPGSAWDQTCQQIGTLLYATGQLDAPLRITHMPGGAGGLALANTASARGGDPELIVAASQATLTLLAQGRFPDIGADQVRFLGALAADPGVIVVPAESRFESLAALLSAIMRDPAALVITGGTPEGGFDHLKALMLLEAAGSADPASLRYVGRAGGEAALLEMLGGFADAMSGDLSEVMPFLASGDLRALAVLSEVPVRGLEGIPTARQEGAALVAMDWVGVYAPKDISAAELDAWRARLSRLVRSAEWQGAMAAAGLLPFPGSQVDFHTWAEREIARMEAMLTKLRARD